MRIGIVQSSPTFGDVASNLEACRRLMSEEAADLWVLPELFATGYQFLDAAEALAMAESVPDGPTTRALRSFAAAHACHIVAGLPERDGDAAYNAAVLVGPSGVLAVYRKIHLFYKETLQFSPGDRPFPVVDIGCARIGLMICFDHLFPESARSLALGGADIIAHPANLVLPDVAQQTMAVRALENGVFAVTANRVGTESRTDESLTYTGGSQVVDPTGAVLVRLSELEVRASVIEIDVARAHRKSITRYNDKLADRRPEFYSL